MRAPIPGAGVAAALSLVAAVVLGRATSGETTMRDASREPERPVIGQRPAWPHDERGTRLGIVFVSRNPAPDAERGGVPGFGPRHRSLATGGRLMLSFGTGDAHDVTNVLPRFSLEATEPDLFDVSDLSGRGSFGASRILFAGTVHADSGWRIHLFTIDRCCSSRRRVPIPAASVPWRYDDLDPCWLDDTTLVFASTRDGHRSQYDGTPVPQLFRFNWRDSTIARLTAERNGAEEPCVDPRTGRILYSRWWFNRALADSSSPDTVNFWQAVSIAPDGTDPRALSAGPADRRLASLHQPAVAADGSIFGVVARSLGLSPTAGASELVWLRRPSVKPIHVAGAQFGPASSPSYGSARGLAAPSALAPTPLADGRVIFALDPGARGEFGLWVSNRDGSNATELVNLPGTLEMEAVVLASHEIRFDFSADRRFPRPAAAARSAPRPTLSLEPAPEDPSRLKAWPHRFRFLNRDVFGGGFGDRAAASARAAGPVRIRFWAALPRPGSSHHDTLVLVREAPVSPSGRVDERDLPAGIPMFEQLVDTRGHVLMSAHGPAHVAGYNAGIPGGTSSCIGCHRGHSTKR